MVKENLFMKIRLSVGLVLACVFSTHSDASDQLPNILLILADDVGVEPIGAYGGERWPTPHIDSLAGTGVKFHHCYSMPVCHPTRVCLLTGRYPFRLSSPWGSFPADHEKLTIANLLRNRGYRTAVAGKWQLGLMRDDPQQPERMGFDEWSVFGWHEGARYHNPMIYQNGKVREDTTGTYGPDLYVEFLAEFMQRCQRDEQPFFAFYSMALAHDVTDDLETQVPYVPGLNRWMDYGEMVVSMDDMVGRIVETLETQGQREDTLILFTGDNGTAARSKLRHISGRKYEYEKVFSMRNGQQIPGGKGTLMDIGTHVPLLASWPGRISPGTTNDSLVDFSDWLPTLAEVAGTEPGWSHDGHSFLSAATEQRDTSARKFAFAESSRGSAWVRNQCYKLYADGRFFDVCNDPNERSELRELSAQQQVTRQELQSQLQSLMLPKKFLSR